MRQLRPLPLLSPGFAGLNKQEAGLVASIGPEYALELDNAVFDDATRVAARKGYVKGTGTGLPAGETVDVLHEYMQADGTVTLIAVTSDNDILESDDNGTSWTSRLGAVTFTDTNWQFVNFNGKVIGIQDGKIPIVKSGTGNFAEITESSGTAPSGGAGTAGFGRLWIVDSDGQTIQYCDLLDETEWSNAGSGSIDMRNVWTQGIDTVQAIAVFGATLVVFGRRHIIQWIDNSGSQLGIDPSTMYVVDTIEGTGVRPGCRDTVQAIGEGDLFYVSDQGVQSLVRVMEERSNPLITVTEPIRDFLNVNLQAETGRAHAIHNQEEGFYLLALPNAGVTFMCDTKKRIRGQVRSSQWTLNPQSMVSRRDNSLYFGFTAETGRYGTFTDDTDSYVFTYTSPHLDLGAGVNLKILKRLGNIALISGTQNINYKWGFDFSGLTKSLTRTVEAGFGAEWGVAEWGSNGSRDPDDGDLTPGTDISEWGGAVALRVLKVPGSGKGRYIQIGLTVTINGGQFAIQSLDVYAKQGRVT